MIVFDSSLEHQHSSVRKFAQRWFGPYVVTEVHNNGTYSLRELDGTFIRIPVAGKRIKVFRRRDGQTYNEDIEASLLQQQDEGDQQSLVQGEDEEIDD